MSPSCPQSFATQISGRLQYGQVVSPRIKADALRLIDESGLISKLILYLRFSDSFFGKMKTLHRQYHLVSLLSKKLLVHSTLKCNTC